MSVLRANLHATLFAVVLGLAILGGPLEDLSRCHGLIDLAPPCMVLSTDQGPGHGSPVRTPEPVFSPVFFGVELCTSWQLDGPATDAAFGCRVGLNPASGFGRRLDRPPQA
ncbi:MAG: hypothetical protein MUC50_09835 [Myxococcota bacterium]|nr:hypothetical protein [Myxococcota bacterium]